MSVWRIYRLPGSRNFWHIDLYGVNADEKEKTMTVENSDIINVTAIEFNTDVKTVDIKCGFPRAWLQIEYEKAYLHIVNGKAIFDDKMAVDSAAEAVRIAAEALEGKNICAAARD